LASLKLCAIVIYIQTNTNKRKQTNMNIQNIDESINSICIYDWEEALFNLELIDDYELSPSQLIEKIIKCLNNKSLSEKDFNDIIAWYSKREYNQ